MNNNYYISFDCGSKTLAYVLIQKINDQIILK